MPKTIKLSWQPGVGNREGRWRKIYRGKAYHFPGGKGKSDREGYDAAWAAWEILQAMIDRTAPRKHQQDYEAALDEWERVLAWSNHHADKEYAEIATHKLERLRKRLASLVLPPLDRLDRLESCLGGSLARDPEWLAEIEKLIQENAKRPAGERIESFFGDAKERTPDTAGKIEKHAQVDRLLTKILSSSESTPGPRQLIKPSKDWDGSPGRIAREIWLDRLRVQIREAASEDDSLKTHVQKYVGRREKHGNAGQISVGRVRATGLHLSQFQDFLGKDFDVAKIDEQVLEDFHEHLLDKVASRTWSGSTASDCMVGVKSFVRWMWSKKAIANLPRNLDPKCKDLWISKSTGRIEVFTKDELKVLLAKASDRTKLYILLMLNCGMTQKDIADLHVSEVDWTAGRVIRKRSKTADEENVPKVDYLLWPETFRLLQQERAAESKGRVLLNSNGSAIWSEKIADGGKYRKTDNVKNAFDRLRKTENIDKPLKSLKKTSATLLRNNKDFSGLESLFLGHAPRSMADKHYAGVPQELLDEAVTWLGQEFGLIAPAAATKAEESAAKPSDSTPTAAPDATEPAANRESKTRSRRAGRRSKASDPQSTASDPAMVAAGAGG